MEESRDLSPDTYRDRIVSKLLTRASYVMIMIMEILLATIQAQNNGNQFENRKNDTRVAMQHTRFIKEYWIRQV